ncbi:MAG: EFR1 family ferrodoxin [Candidatus Limivicinus sp.]|jgi:ferredoxin
MSKNIIFCFSASGNCLDIAKNIASRLHDTDIIMMRGEPAVTDVSEAKRVGFVFPCYAGGLPTGVEEYVSKLTVSPKTYTFGVISYAGYKGTGLAKINRHVPLDYWTGISHQCSCIWLFPHMLMMPPMSPEQAQKRSEKLAKKVAEDILNKKFTMKKPSSNPVNAAEAKAWPMLVKMNTAKMRVEQNCIGCGQCVELCPTGNIKLVNGRAEIGGNCIQCLSCLQYCPQKAINLGGLSVKRERYHNPNVSAKELSQSLIHID